ncbi:MAG: hypothetical protein JF592_09995 [Microbacterium sp.]|uniref:hypothetical protein n=1 Tax=Microbacterium sp. TaxID=51671 RepID=UPI001D357014|nr:hypothetical protein [Microbacterium sp.]MBW8762902.1 hypothetical protein [Microbacterium sp.]
MTSHRTASHALAGIGAALLMVAVLSGCTPEPEPTPTPTAAFASEEEAFAAAEEVYREYNSAADRSDADTERFLTGPALDEYLEGAEYLDANGLTLGGETVVVSFTGDSVDAAGKVGRVTATACIDLSKSTVINSSGVNVTPPDRAPAWRFTLTFVGDQSGLLIEKSLGEEDPTCAQA